MYRYRFLWQKNDQQYTDYWSIRITLTSSYASEDISFGSWNWSSDHMTIGWAARYKSRDRAWRCGLIEKWLFAETFSNNRRLIYPNPVQSLQQLVDLHKAKIQQMQLQVDQTISLLQGIQLQGKFLPQVRFAKWHDWVRKLYKEILEDINSFANLKASTLNQNIYIISDSRHFDDIIDNKFLDQFVDKNIYIHLILPQWYEHFVFTYNSRLGKKFESREYEHSLWRNGAMAIWWDKVAMFSYEGIYITTTTIQNKPIHNMMMASRKAIWDINK